MLTLRIKLKGTRPSSPYRPTRFVDFLTHKILRKNFVCINSKKSPSLKADISDE